jgi:hypothetical protein
LLELIGEGEKSVFERFRIENINGLNAIYE